LAVWEVDRLESLVFGGGICEPGEGCKYCMLGLCVLVFIPYSHGHSCDIGALARSIGERERKMSVSDGQADVQEVEYIAWGYMGSVNDRE